MSVKTRNVVMGAALLLAGFAKADDLATARSVMGPALGDLGLMDDVTLVATGTEDINGNVTNVSARVSVRRVGTGPGTQSLVELVSYRGTTLQQRVVANGSRMWFYNAPKHEYSVWNYSGGTNPDQAMLLTLKKHTSGLDTLLGQLLLEAHEARVTGTLALTNRWRPFMPMAQVTYSTGNVQCVSTVPDYKEINYAVTEPTPGDYQIDHVDIYGERKLAAGIMFTQVTVAVHRDTLVPATDFSFNPGTAKPVSLGIRQGS